MNATAQPLSLLALVAAAVSACASPVDHTENKLPYLSEREVVQDVAQDSAGDSGGDAIDDGSEGEANACDCLTVGRWYRFDTLVLTSLDGKEHPVVPTLNGLWKSDIDALELDILLEVIDVTATSAKMRVLNGARIDGTQQICAFEDTAIELDFPRSGCRLETSNESAFNVYAGTESYPKTCATTLPVKNAIPVSRAKLHGDLRPDCGAILNGKVPGGGLAQREIAQVCTCLLLPGKPAEDCGLLDPSFNDTVCVGCNAKYQSLGALLTAFGEPEWLCQTEDGAPSACITADFSAVAIEAPVSCSE